MDQDPVVKDNVYDRGFFHNVSEIISPLSTRASFASAKSKAN